MSLTIPDHYQIKYADTFQDILQQKTQKLAQFATQHPNPSGRVCFLDQIETIELDQKTSRHEESQLTEPTTRRRAMTQKTFTKMVGFDEDDDFKLGQQSVPMPQTGRQLMYAGARTIDNVFIQGISGDNQVGAPGSDLLEVEAFPAANEIPVTYGAASGNTNFPIEKAMKVIENLMTDEAFGELDDSEMGMPCLGLAPSQLVDLIRQDRIASRDFQNNGGNLAITTGRVEALLGCKILLSNRFEVASNIRTCLAWVKPAVQFGLWKGYSSRLFIHDESGGIRQRVHMACGAARAHSTGVYKIYCDETKTSAA